MAKNTNNSQYAKRYITENYGRIEFVVRKDVKAELTEYAKSHGFESLSDLICHSIEQETGIACKPDNALPWIPKKYQKTDEK